MKFMAFEISGREGLAVESNGMWKGLFVDEDGFPGSLDNLVMNEQDLGLAAKALLAGRSIDPDSVSYLPPLKRPSKIICVGLNYRDHSEESNFEQPDYPMLFTRFHSTLTGHGRPIIKPGVSDQLDYEGEIVAIIGKGCRNTSRADALNHISGWSLFNDASIRDYQFRTPQWTVGKNFDTTGPFGPWFVTADEIPPGARDLVLETRLNGKVVQKASTNDMVFDPETLIVTLSEVMTLEPGDLIVTGTPAGVGFARKPPLWMKAGDVIEVEVKGLGLLSNPIADS
jgi:acylpyruvate hydrolase